MVLASFEMHSDTGVQDQNLPDEPCDKLLQIFHKIIVDLHKYSEENKNSQKNHEVTEERKANMGAVNNDESVRLQQETEIDEIEKKSNRDKDIHNQPSNLPKIEERIEEVKRAENKNTNFQESNQQQNTTINSNNLESRNVVEKSEEKAPLGMTTPVKSQNVIDLENTPSYQNRMPQNMERNLVDQRQIPASIQNNVMQHNLNVRSQPPQNNQNLQSPMHPSMVAQPPHHLPGLSNIGLNMERMQIPGMPNQMIYPPIRSQQPFIHMNQPNFGLNRGNRPGQVQLPGLNQFVSGLNSHQYQTQPSQGIPYYGNMQLKNLINSHQGRMQGSPGIPMYMNHPNMGRMMQSPPPGAQNNYPMGQLNQGQQMVNHQQMNQNFMKPNQFPYHK